MMTLLMSQAPRSCAAARKRSRAKNNAKLRAKAKERTMEMIEVTANSVDAAISKGLSQLNAAPADVMVEVLEEPNTGLFGFGAREARVRLVLIGQRKAPPSEVYPEDVDNAYEERDQASEEPRDVQPTAGVITVVADVELDEDATAGLEVLEALLSRMGIDGQIHISRSEEVDGEPPHWMLNITGERINRLIGRRGETLASLQHIVRLICSRRLERRANIIVDAEGYKTGRSNRLRGLAKRMAKQAVQQGRTITLEPMQPSERRIIHLTLRDRDDVSTQSIGEGRARKVTIVPN
ncbi:MAG: KH domain-containing protein [Chloroflexi bacterium]|nr:KH domain-containing protein [Chloroflexota bacterium]MXX83089.1 KH domain-containing protein [Chloroflexota bacterium]MYC55588.1 KH domain-containing protein [Chloroflexota bacterium]MYH65064.1 KH domain-containing protein [Chloroflexota bacterium]